MTGDRSVLRPAVMGDVARLAGVSVPTVSRVLTGAKKVRPETTERVRSAIEHLGYRPNGAARALVSGRGTLVSVLAGQTVGYGYARTIAGIEQAVRDAGLTLAVTVIPSAEPDVVASTIDVVLAQPVAGVVVLEFDRPGLAAAQALPTSVPVVVAGGGARRSTGRGSAHLDERASGRAATEHLLGLGHLTVHHVAGPTMGKSSGRTAGWRAALKAAGAGVPEVLRAEWDPRSGYACAERLLERAGMTAVFCANDEIAIGLLRAFADRGISVPDDVSVVGFDDQPMVEMWRPALTTVRQDFDDLGRRAFAALLDLLQGKEPGPASVVVPPLVIRESTAPPGDHRPRPQLL